MTRLGLAWVALVVLAAGCAPRDRVLLPWRHCPEGTEFEGTDLYHACAIRGVGLAGPYRAWHPDGTLRATAIHRVGALEGPLRYYGQAPPGGGAQGPLLVEASYVSGQRDGVFRARAPEGGVVEGQLLQGMVVGRWSWIQDGAAAPRTSATYDRNVCVEGDCGRTAGRLPAPFIEPVAGLSTCATPPPPPPTPAAPPARCGPGGPWKVSLVIDPVGLPTQVMLEEGPASEEARECLLETVRTVLFAPPEAPYPCRRTFSLDPSREAAPLRPL